MAVTEFKIKADYNIVRWTDEKGNENMIRKGSMLQEDFASAMKHLAKMVAFHLELPEERITAVGIQCGVDTEGDWWSLIGSLANSCKMENIVVAKKLRKHWNYDFFPSKCEFGVYYNCDGDVVKDEALHLPKDHLDLITEEERTFIDDMLDMAMEYAKGVERREPDLFDQVEHSSDIEWDDGDDYEEEDV